MTHRRRFLLAAAAIAAPSLARAQAKLQVPAKWYALKADDNAFTVEMPGIPDHKVMNDASVRGTAFVLHSYSLEYGGNSYVAQTALFPMDVDFRQPQRVLQVALDERAKQLSDGKWTKTDWSLIDGAAAVESTGSLVNGNQLRLLSLAKEQRYVSLAFMGVNIFTPDAERFLKSVKLK
jgi:hypothetical protein